jgi:hypothetical protein
MPDGYRIGSHWHSTEENVTVLSGTLVQEWATNLIRRAANF